ncbi:MAG: HAMP domain-containing protein [Paracoccaceae bacterium]|jgi:HAMP domain-containing protein
MAAPPRRLLVSQIALNREATVNAHSGMPMLRTMIRTGAEDCLGDVIIVLNPDARHLLNDLRGALPSLPGARFVVATQSGDPVFNTASELDFGATDARRDVIKATHALIGDTLPLTGAPAMARTPYGDLIAAASMQAGNGPPGRDMLEAWIPSPRDEAYRHSDAALRLARWLVPGVALIGGLAAWAIGADLSRGLRRLHDAARQVTAPRSIGRATATKRSPRLRGRSNRRSPACIIVAIERRSRPGSCTMCSIPPRPRSSPSTRTAGSSTPTAPRTAGSARRRTR